MINVDLQDLIQALDPATRRDLEACAERCVGRGAHLVVVEDLLLGLLERPDSLLMRALLDADIDAGQLNAALQPRTEQGASRNPVFAPELIQWLQDALLVAHLELKQAHVDQAALLLVGHWYAHRETDPAVSDIPMAFWHLIQPYRIYGL